MGLLTGSTRSSMHCFRARGKSTSRSLDAALFRQTKLYQVCGQRTAEIGNAPSDDPDHAERSYPSKSVAADHLCRHMMVKPQALQIYQLTASPNI